MERKLGNLEKAVQFFRLKVQNSQLKIPTEINDEEEAKEL